MADTQLEQLALIDLGLLTRVVCHELNNLIANQRGYARLLAQRGVAGEDGARWLAELVGASTQLQGLVGGVQAWSRRQESPGLQRGEGAIGWPPGPALAARAQSLLAAGVGLSTVALSRVLMIVAQEAGASPDDWSDPEGTSAPAEGALFGTCAEAGAIVLITIPDRGGGAAWHDWTTAADRILPPADADQADWARALTVGLLRQSGADLFHQAAGRAHPATYALALPIRQDEGAPTGAGKPLGIQSY